MWKLELVGRPDGLDVSGIIGVKMIPRLLNEAQGR